MVYADKEDALALIKIVGFVLLGFVFIMMTWVLVGIAIILGGSFYVFYENDCRTKSKWGDTRNMPYGRKWK